jgi:putative membrane protein
MADDELPRRDDGGITTGGGSWLAHIVRFVVAAIVLMVVSYVTPGFTRLSFWHALLAAVLIVVIGYALESIFGRKISPYTRGGIGFLVSALIFYTIQFVVPGMRVTLLGALIAAIIVGVIDMFVPTGIR